MARRIIRIIVILCLSIVIGNIYVIHWWVTVTDVTISPSRSSFFRRQVEYNQEEDQVHPVLQTTKIPKFINTTTSFVEKYKVENNIKTKKDKENVGWEFHIDPPLPKEEEIDFRSYDRTIQFPISNNESSYNAIEYQLKLEQSLKPNKDAGTSSSTWIFFKSWAGLCNQYMMFIGAVILAIKEGHDQIIEESIQWKDTYGQEKYLQHQKLFDIVHWNSFYPQLPRIVQYDKRLHPDIKVRAGQEEIEGKRYSKVAFLQENVKGGPFELAKNPTPLGQSRRQTMNQYKMFTKRVDQETSSVVYVPAKVKMGVELIMKSAFRPHPQIQSFIDDFVKGMRTSMKQNSSMERKVGDGFMVLHARVEPDMQNHPMCKDKKVKNITDVIESMYRQYPEPPVSWVVLIFNRKLVEALVTGEKASQMIANKELNESFQVQSIQELTAYNLQVINDCLENGLWNGRVRVKEAGSKYVEEISTDPWYSHYSNIVGGILNFFMAIQSDIFVGTEVSSYSTLVANSRFYRGQRNNYFYRPNGLYWVTPPNATKPHRFVC